MKKTIIRVISILCFVAINTNVSAQSSATKGARKIIAKEKEAFQKVADDDKLLDKKTIVASGTLAANYEKKYNLKNGYCTAEDYNVPKKIGLLSFYIDDEEYSTSTIGGGWITTTTYKADAKKVNRVAQIIYEQSIEVLKASYAKMGLELLTPEEFLVTEKQKTMYYEAPLPNLELKSKVFSLVGSGSAVPEGFRFLPYASYFLHTGVPFAKEKDLFLNQVGMDAYIVVAIKLSAAGGLLKTITSTFTYKNPGYDSSDKVGTYGVGYTPYTVATANMNFAPPIAGIFIKKEEEYTNKKGKADIRFIKTGVDNGFTNLLNTVVVSVGKTAQSQIPMKEKKKK